MSRFKLFALMQMALASIMHNSSLSSENKQEQANLLNKKSGGILFGGYGIPSNLPNQRQRRKLNRQQPHGKKF